MAKLERRIDELYAGTASDFVKRRDALAKELKADGEAADAGEVSGLRKPSAAAAAINLAVRSDPAAAKALAKAGAALAKAQAGALEGKAAARGRLRGAKAAEQEAIERLLAAASDAADKPPSAATLDRARETLGAVASDPDVAEEVAAGRVSTDHRAVGLGGDLAAALASAPAKRRDSGAAKRAAKAVADAERKRDQAAARVDSARRALGEAQQRAADAKAEVKDAERSLADAENELGRASAKG